MKFVLVDILQICDTEEEVESAAESFDDEYRDLFVIEVEDHEIEDLQ